MRKETDVAERIMGVISRLKTEPERYRDKDGIVYEEKQGEYLPEVTEAICKDITHYSSIFLNLDNKLIPRILGWSWQLNVINKALVKEKEEYMAFRPLPEWDDHALSWLMDDVVETVRRYVKHEEEPYKSFLILCYFITRRLYYIDAWHYMISEMDKMGRIKTDDKDVQMMIYCRKKLLDVFIQIRDTGEDQQFIENELEWSGSALYARVGM